MADWRALSQVAAGAPDAGRIVAHAAAGPWDHAAFVAEVAGWQTALQRVAGNRVALFADDPARFAAALFGAWHAGKTVCLPGDAQPGTIARLLPSVDAGLGDLPGALAAPAPRPGVPLPPLDPAHTRLVVHTSGSSGEPLAIAKTLGQLDAEVHALEAQFGASLREHADLRVGSTVSHQHIYGLLFHVLWPLAAGRPFITRRLSFPEDMSRELAGGRHVLVASPAHLKRLPAGRDWAPLRDCLVAVFSSGGPLPPEAAAHVEALWHRSPVEVYGSSETGGIAWRQRAVHGDRWQALPHVVWRLETDGCLSVQSPHLPDAQWWTTADRAEAVGDGFLLRGRVDRIVKIEEKRVSLDALEQALLANGLLRDVRVVDIPASAGHSLAVVGVPSDAGAAVLRQHGKRALNERLRNRLLQDVERVVLPRRFRYVDAMPVNPVGKTPLAALQALFRPEHPEPCWVSREAAQAVLTVSVDGALRAFDGHFPGTPVLPGVVLVHWAMAWGRSAFALPPNFRRLDALKFQQPVVPGLLLVLTLSWQAERGLLQFSYRSDAGVHASGTALYAFDTDA